MIKQKAVRTVIDFTGSGNERLNKYLDDGWYVILCSQIKYSDGGTELEYIIQKEVEE